MLKFRELYSYDGWNRLTQVREERDAGSENWVDPLEESYCYDAQANRAVVARANLHALIPRVSTCTAAEVSALYPGNRLAATTYDLGGAMLWDGKSAFVVDGEDRLVRSTPVLPAGATPTEYEYDGEGRRVVKRTGAARVVYVYDAMGQLAAEYGGTNDLPGVGPHYLHTDALGSTRLVTDAAGAAQKRADYWPFGLEKNALVAETAYRTAGLKYGAGVDPALRFTGKERDGETGLDYFGARYLSGVQGRFASADAPFADQHPDDPQSWNRYGYVRNNPLRYVDPTGREQAEPDEEKEEGDNANGSPKAAKPAKPKPKNQPVDPAPTDHQGRPKPPPVPVPGCPTCEWKWVPDVGNPRGGTWKPTGWPSGPGGIPGGSWDTGSRGGPGHWDIDDGNGNRTRHYPDGRPMPDDIAHPPGWRPIWTRTILTGVGAGATGYFIYRGIRLVPSLFPPLWPTLIPNLVSPF